MTAAPFYEVCRIITKARAGVKVAVTGVDGGIWISRGNLETQRYVNYQTRGALFQVPFTDRQGPQGDAGFLSARQVEALGADSLDYRILNQKLLDELQASRGITERPAIIIPLGPSGLPRPELSEEVKLKTIQGLIESNLSSVMIPVQPLP